MPDYQRGKIYKIVSNIDDELCYIGSTTKKLLCQRMGHHKNRYKNWKNGKYHFVTSFELFDKYGIEGCRIELLEIFPCNSKDELAKKEAEYIRNLNCVNKVIPNRTKKEYYEANRDTILENKKEYQQVNRDTIAEYQKEYYEANRDTLLEKRKEYYEANRDTLLENKKEYQQANKSIIAERKKEYYEANKSILAEKKKEKYTCVCGSTLRKDSKCDHEKSQKHMNYISSNTI